MSREPRRRGRRRGRFAANDRLSRQLSLVRCGRASIAARARHQDDGDGKRLHGFVVPKIAVRHGGRPAATPETLGARCVLRGNCFGAHLFVGVGHVSSVEPVRSLYNFCAVFAERLVFVKRAF
jgi:hypothetical protein